MFRFIRSGTEFIKKCKRHPVVTLFSMLFATAISIAAFTDAVSSLSRYWPWSRLPEVSVTLAGGTGPSKSPPPNATHYQLTRDGNVINIEPKITDLERRLRKGEVIEGPRYQGFFEWEFPNLSFKLANNSPETILLSEVVFIVERSAIDNDPILVVAPRAKAGSILIRNEGWGRVVNPVLDLGIYPLESCSPAKFRTETVKGKKLSDFTARTTVNISSYLPTEFVSNYRRCAAGTGKHCSVCVYSALSYQSTDGSTKEVKYATRLFPDDSEYGDDSAVGGSLDSTGEYGTFLKVSKSGYEVRIPISQEIRPKEAEHFSISVWTDRSAHFRLRVLLVDSEGRNIGDKRVSIGIFVPRSAHLIRQGRRMRFEDF